MVRFNVVFLIAKYGHYEMAFSINICFGDACTSVCTIANQQKFPLLV